MVTNKGIFIAAAIITAMLFISIYSFNMFLNTQRERVVIDKMEEVLDEYQELQVLSLMSDVFGKEMTCLSLESRLVHMDKTLWDAGVKIDKYREVTEKFVTDPFYIDQKRKFNRNEIIYLSMLKEMKDWCEFNQTIILYFYKKKEDCPDCDAQSFVLTNLNKEIDDEIAIFSFDSDLQLPSVKTLELFYNITSYPCLVIEYSTYCGLHNRNSLVDLLCEYKDISLCS
jgi:thiol-disulfide isomerase/thioredoxin